MPCFMKSPRLRPTQWSSYLNTAPKQPESSTNSDVQSKQSERADQIFTQCTKCGEVKPSSDFYKDNTRRSGSSRQMTCCKVCNGKAASSKRQAAKKLFGRGFHRQLKESRPPEGTPCQICRRPMVYRRSASLMCFDHDPVTHEFRGWICQNCNTAIGKLGDNLAGLMAAVLYLSNEAQWVLGTFMY